MTDFIQPQDVDANIVNQLMLAVEDDNVQTLYDLGYLCYWGHAVALDYDRGLEYFSRTAAQNHADVMFNLGVVHEHGQGTPRNLTTACQWFEHAVYREGTLSEYARLWQEHREAMQNVVFALSELLAQVVLRLAEDENPPLLVLAGKGLLDIVRAVCAERLETWGIYSNGVDGME